MRQPDTLKDLPGVIVIVENFRRAAEDIGFDGQTFQTDVELKLRMAGIKATEDTSLPRLYLNINPMPQERNGRFPYSISLELIQRVLLPSQLSHETEKRSEEALATSTMSAITWSTGMLGFGPVSHARESVKDVVDKFVNDWLSVNPMNGTR